MKNPSTSAIEEAYLQKKLVDRGYTQEEIVSLFFFFFIAVFFLRACP